MSSLKYYSYKGVGEENRKNYWYSQVVRVPPNRLELAGQGKQSGADLLAAVTKSNDQEDGIPRLEKSTPTSSRRSIKLSPMSTWPSKMRAGKAGHRFSA